MTIETSLFSRRNISRSAIPTWLIVVIVAGVLARITTGWTKLRVIHPDEFYQTLEFGHLFLYGFMKHVGEVDSHLRNLSWPAIVAAPYWLAGLVDSPQARLFAVRMFLAVLNLTILWGTIRVLQNYGIRERRILLGWTTFYFGAWFFIDESVRTSIEHGSAICIWGALGLLTLQNRTAKFGSGVLLVWTGVVKYPAGLLGVGALCAVLIRQMLRKEPLPQSDICALLLGVIFGLCLGGLADYLVYGRPYESLWLYLQYNVLTGLSAQIFGSYSSAVYLEFLNERLGGPLFPALIPVVLFAPIGIYRGLKNCEPWAFAWVFFVVGHLFPAHKEPRFMVPVMHLTLIATIFGAWQCRHVLTPYLHKRPVINGLKITVGIIVLVNIIKSLEVMRGDFWKVRGDFFTVSEKILDKNSCGLITVGSPLAFQFPYRNLEKLRERPIGILSAGSSFDPEVTPPSSKKFAWYPDDPSCSQGERIYLHLHQRSDFWTRAGCTPETIDFLFAGLRAQLPKVELVVYSCPPTIANLLSESPESRLAYQIPKLRRLPPLGVTAEELPAYFSDENFVE